MEVDSDNGLLDKLAVGEEIESSAWPQLRDEMIEQLNRIARNEFPIPKLPPPIPPRTRLLSPLPSSPLEHDSSQEADKENAPAAERPAAPSADDAVQAVQHLEPGELPKQIMAMLDGIIAHLRTFQKYPPHTIQRLAELVLRPRAHYKALAPYLHAVDRVLHVTSSTNVYPLPPAIPDMTSMSINGDGEVDPAAAVGWSNPTNGAAAAAADEALGGALLTPIPWLNRCSPDSSNGESSSNGGGSGAQIHSESTETIDGPNGVGSIETVSVSINGVSSTGHARGVTQGELLRQEQQAGVVPVSQLSRHNGHGMNARGPDEDGDDDEEDMEGEIPTTAETKQPGEEDEEVPHARGPEEIGAGDIGPQSVSTSFVGDGGLESHDIDVEAAVGRKHDPCDPVVPVPATAESDAKEEGSGEEKVSEDDEKTEAADGVVDVVDPPEEDGQVPDSQPAPAPSHSAVGTKRGPDEVRDDEHGLTKKVKAADEMDTDDATQ